MAPHSSTLAWKIPWTEEPGRLQSMGSLRVGHDWATSLSLFAHALEKEMATHSSVLAWGIPGTGKPGGLLSMGSHRVGHDWSDLAAAAAAAPTLQADSSPSEPQGSPRCKGKEQNHVLARQMVENMNSHLGHNWKFWKTRKGVLGRGLTWIAQRNVTGKPKTWKDLHKDIYDNPAEKVRRKEATRTEKVWRSFCKNRTQWEKWLGFQPHSVWRLWK